MKPSAYKRVLLGLSRLEEVGFVLRRCTLKNMWKMEIKKFSE